MIESISTTALSGIQRGLSQAAGSAQRIVTAFQPESEEDPVAPIVDLTKAEQQVKASAKVLKVGDELVGSILDIFA